MLDEKQQKLQLNQNIKYMEELSLNAWPSYKIELYDGWLIRFSACPMYDRNGVSTEQGIEPDYNVQMNAEDAAKGIDTIIEYARQLLH